MTDRIKIKVISGGQCGIDIAALRAAKERGYATGGTMPKGWMTQKGPKPEYAADESEKFGMVE